MIYIGKTRRPSNPLPGRVENLGIIDYQKIYKNTVNINKPVALIYSKLYVFFRSWTWKFAMLDVLPISVLPGAVEQHTEGDSTL